MMRGAFDHPKFKLVARDLKLPMCYVRGIMESIWLVAGTNFPRGDIGRWDNEQIAISIDYPGDADALVESLLKRKLLDPLPEADGRLYVHDWHEHSDRYTNLRLLKTKQRYANGAPARTKEHDAESGTPDDVKEREGTRGNAKQRETPREIATNTIPEPEPEPVPEPEPEPAAAAAERGAPAEEPTEPPTPPRWPLTLAAMNEHITGTDEPMAEAIAAACKGVDPPPDDGELAAAVRATAKRHQRSAALWKSTVPAFLVSERKKRAAPPARSDDVSCQVCNGSGVVYLNCYRMPEFSGREIRHALEQGKISLCECPQGRNWEALLR